MKDPKARFSAMVGPADANGCWPWAGYVKPTGYGQFHLDRPQNAHRAAWLLFRGAIAPGQHVDHLCRNRVCVNPDHLEAVAHKENVLRGAGPTADNAKKSTCKRGHSLTDAYVYKGMRQCRICTCAKVTARRRQLKAEAA
jgi:hypothetical protein